MSRKNFFWLVVVGCFLLIGSVATASAIVSLNMSNDKFKTFVKTKNRCDKCSCSGYWGYKHYNGTYEGDCKNTDGHGHRCGHGPEKHGLKKW